MQIIKKQVTDSCHYDFSSKYPLEQLLFFDIETTGLSADVSSLYLIGCVYYEQKNWQLIQWFADEYHEEQNLLAAFFEFSSKYSYLLHYNGNGFDIPYLEKKCKQYDLEYNFNNIESIDLYKKFLPYKKLLHLSSIKQKKVEELFGLYRQDKYSGGELIKVYVEYMHGKIMHKKNNKHLEELKDTLLLHNHEDLTGLLYVTPILTFEDMLMEESKLLSYDYSDNFLILSVAPPTPLPLEFTISKEDGWSFESKKGTGIMTIPVSNNQFKLYYENYKDYFYLPTEDTAVHKSVAAYVDKDYRQKATKENCYSKITITDTLLADNTQLSQCFQKLLKYYIKLK